MFLIFTHEYLSVMMNGYFEISDNEEQQQSRETVNWSNSQVEQLSTRAKCMTDATPYSEILASIFFVYLCIDLRIYRLMDEFI